MPEAVTSHPPHMGKFKVFCCARPDPSPTHYLQGVLYNLICLSWAPESFPLLFYHECFDRFCPHVLGHSDFCRPPHLKESLFLWLNLLNHTHRHLCTNAHTTILLGAPQKDLACGHNPGWPAIIPHLQCYIAALGRPPRGHSASYQL